MKLIPIGLTNKEEIEVKIRRFINKYSQNQGNLRNKDWKEFKDDEPGPLEILFDEEKLIEAIKYYSGTHGFDETLRDIFMARFNIMSSKIMVLKTEQINMQAIYFDEIDPLFEQISLLNTLILKL
jgi:hypothetical protein